MADTLLEESDRIAFIDHEKSVEHRSNGSIQMTDFVPTNYNQSPCLIGAPTVLPHSTHEP